MTNYLKTECKVDPYIPARENMSVYQDAIKLATISGNWQKYPNRKRKDQEIQLVTDLGPLWESDEPEKDVSINACIVHDLDELQRRHLISYLILDSWSDWQCDLSAKLNGFNN